MTWDESGLRREIMATALRMNSLGINQGKSGNVSVRWAEGLLITPTGVAYESLSPQDVVLLGMDGGYQGPQAPSSEWRFHRDIYARKSDVNAIVHAHSPYCTTLACLNRGIPAFHYMVAVAGGRDIRCASYATLGTQRLSDHVLIALEGRKACLLANHGMIALGANLERALALAMEVESLARMFWQTLQIGEPVLLDDAEMDRVIEKFKTYGQAKDGGI